MAYEHEDDFVVLTRNSETRSDGDDQLERLSNLSLTDPLTEDIQPTKNPIADVIQKVSQENDEAWISHSDELSAGWQHVTEVPLSGFTVLPISHDWLAADDGVSKGVPLSSGLESEKGSLRLKKSCGGLSQWLIASSSPVDGACAKGPREKNLFPFTLLTRDANEGSKFNPLSHVFSSSYNQKFGLHGLPVTATKQSVPRRRSLKRGGVKKMGIGKSTTSDEYSQDGDSPQLEGFFTKVVAKIDAKPIDFWLVSDEAKKLPSDSRLLSHWLCPSSAAGETACCRLSEDPRTSDITSSNPSTTDCFSGFTRRIINSPTSEWLLAPKSMDYEPSEFNASSSSVTSSSESPASGWCSFKFKSSNTA